MMQTTLTMLSTGEKPFPQLRRVRAELSLSHHLTRYCRTHTGEQHFHSDECGQNFADSCNITKHRRTQVGEIPFRCDECGQSFSESSISPAIDEPIVMINLRFIESMC